MEAQNFAKRQICYTMAEATSLVLPPALLAEATGPGEERAATNSPNDALEAMSTFWKRIWNRDALPEELQRLRSQQLSRLPGAPMPGSWQLTPEELLQAARKKTTESCGPDGWSAAEVCHWPIAAWRILLLLWERWIAANQFPEVWRHSRQVMLPKAEGPFGQVRVEDMRPIAIQPVVCRIISSAFAKRQETQAWLQHLVPNCTHGAIPGREAATAILPLQAAFDQGGILMSLDQAKCFDHVIPELAVGLLSHAGMHPEWIRHLQWTWSDQHRWMQFGRHTANSPERVSTSIPQGCAMAPIALVILMLEATCAVQTLQLGHEVLTQSVYIDDRAIACSSPQLAVLALQTWQHWSQRLGLRENLHKMQIVCKSVQKRAAMIASGIDPQIFVESTRVLGVDFCSQRETLPPTAQKRVDTAWKILPRLTLLRVGQAFKELLYRTRCSPLVSWGLWFHGHTSNFERKWITKLKSVLKAQRMGSRALWTLLQGHWLSPIVSADIAAVCSFLRAVNFWHRRGVTFDGGPWFSRIRRILMNAGFAETNPFVWQHDLFGTFRFITNNCTQTSQHLAHMLREVWRRGLFKSFLEHNRRDSRQLLQSGAEYCEAQVGKARKTFSTATSHERAVMVGAANSLAVYQQIEHNQVTSFCPYCQCASIPDWDHLSWFCPFFSSSRPPIPNDPLARRLGWCHNGTADEAKALIAHLAEVRSRILLDGNLRG
jgi:hypothetical protein